MSTLCLDGVSRQVYGAKLLDAISLVFPDRALSLLIGPNGAGKTTLLRVCAGLDRPSAGRVRFLSPQGKPESPAPGQITMVFQRPVPLTRSVAANIAYPLHLRALSAQVRGKRVDEALTLAGLEQLAGRSALSLSGGEAQRLAVARAFVLQPAVLLLDEPAANLDPESRQRVEAVVLHMREAFGTTVVMTSHDLDHVRRLADALFFMERGRAWGPYEAGQFFANPPPVAAHYLQGAMAGATV